MIKKISQVLFVACSLSSVSFSAMAETVKDPIVAIVDGQEIKKSTLENIQRSVPQLRQAPLESIYDQLLESVINEKIIAIEARKQKLEEDPAVKQRLKEVESKLIQQAYIGKQVEAKVTDKSVEAQYQALVANFKPEELVHARHILVEQEADAKKIIADLKKGAKFDEIAKNKSKDKASAVQGGDLGFFAKGDMVPAFSEAAFALKEGQISEKPVKTQFGWHVIKVEGRKMSEMPSFDQIKDQIRADLAEAAIQETLKDLRAKADVKKFALDGSTTDKKN